MHYLQLSEEQRAIQEMVHDFVNQEIKPSALDAERLEAFGAPLLSHLVEKASELGLRTLSLSEDSGGAGADALTCCIVAEEMAAGDVDVATVLATTSLLGGVLFNDLMTAQQAERFLPAFLEDHDFHLALADHEPQSDTALGINYHRPDLPRREFGTTAAKNGGEWVINGTKTRIANAPIAKLFIVEVAIDGPSAGTSLILVPHDAPGLSVTETPRDGGWYHGACGDVVFEDCRVPLENLLDGMSGKPGWHDVPLAQSINLGVGRAAYEAAVDYAKLREQGGRPIIEHQAIGTKLADIVVSLDAARSAVWQAAWLCDHPGSTNGAAPDLPRGEVARVLTAQLVYRATKDAAECFGAMGVMRDMPLHKYMQDARIMLHSGTGIADAKLRIAEAVAGYRRN